MTNEQEADLLLQLRPSRAEVDEMAEALATVAAGIRRVGKTWRVHPDIAHVVGDHDPGVVLQRMRQGLKVLAIVERKMLSRRLAA